MPSSRRRNYVRKPKDTESDTKSTPTRVLNLRIAGYTRKKVKEIEGSYKESPPASGRASVLRFQSPLESQARPSVPRVEETPEATPLPSSTRQTPASSVAPTPRSSVAPTPRTSAPPTPKESPLPTPKRTVERHGNVEVEVTTERERKDSVGSQLFGSDEESRATSRPQSRGRSTSRSASPVRRRDARRSGRERSRSPARRSRSPARRRSPSGQSASPVRRGRREEDSADEASYADEEESTYREPTEEELQDEYRALIKRLSRMYRYLEIEIPPAGTPSRRLKRLYRYYVDEVAVAEGLVKYKLGLSVGFIILEALGKKMGLPCDGYADLQQEQIANYNDMLVEFGDRGYFGFARNWPVEARLFGMMMVNMGVLIGARLLLEPGNAAKLIKLLVGNRTTPGIQLDGSAPSASPDGAAAAAAGGAAGGGSEAPPAASNPLGALLGGAGGGGGLASILSTVMGALGGGGGGPARERSDQAAPSYRSRRNRA
jgi:hypothetical protein